jgi:hypothetical protein
VSPSAWINESLPSCLDSQLSGSVHPASPQPPAKGPHGAPSTCRLAAATFPQRGGGFYSPGPRMPVGESSPSRQGLRASLSWKRLAEGHCQARASWRRLPPSIRLFASAPRSCPLKSERPASFTSMRQSAERPSRSRSWLVQAILEVNMAPGSLALLTPSTRRKPGFGSNGARGFLPSRYRSPGGPHRRPWLSLRGLTPSARQQVGNQSM